MINNRRIKITAKGRSMVDSSQLQQENSNVFHCTLENGVCGRMTGGVDGRQGGRMKLHLLSKIF